MLSGKDYEIGISLEEMEEINYSLLAIYEAAVSEAVKKWEIARKLLENKKKDEEAGTSFASGKEGPQDVCNVSSDDKNSSTFTECEATTLETQAKKGCEVGKAQNEKDPECTEESDFSSISDQRLDSNFSNKYYDDVILCNLQKESLAKVYHSILTNDKQRECQGTTILNDQCNKSSEVTKSNLIDVELETYKSQVEENDMKLLFQTLECNSTPKYSMSCDQLKKSNHVLEWRTSNKMSMINIDDGMSPVLHKINSHLSENVHMETNSSLEYKKRDHSVNVTQEKKSTSSQSTKGKNIFSTMNELIPGEKNKPEVQLHSIQENAQPSENKSLVSPKNRCSNITTTSGSCESFNGRTQPNGANGLTNNMGHFSHERNGPAPKTSTVCSIENDNSHGTEHNTIYDDITNFLNSPQTIGGDLNICQSKTGCISNLELLKILEGTDTLNEPPFNFKFNYEKHIRNSTNNLKLLKELKQKKKDLRERVKLYFTRDNAKSNYSVKVFINDVLLPKEGTKNHDQESIQSDKSSDCATSHPSSVNKSNQENEPKVNKIQDFVSGSVNALSESDLHKPSENTSAVVSSNNADESNHEISKNDFPSYKPTPIAELNKRHIPVVYAPTKPYSLVRKKEVKESLLYLPRSISKSSSSLSNTYVPSSSGNSTSSCYTYQPSKITAPPPAPKPYSVNECTSLLKDNAFGNEEEKLMVLDRLVEEEFGDNYTSILLNNNKGRQASNIIKESSSKSAENVNKELIPNKELIQNVENASFGLINVSNKSSLDTQTENTSKTDNIPEKFIEKSPPLVEKKDFSCNTNIEKNGLSNKEFSQQKSTHNNKHEHSSKISKESKLSSDDKSKKSHRKTETDKHKSSKEKKSSNKTETHSLEKNKHSSHIDKEHTKTKNSSSNTNSVYSKTKSSSHHKSSTDSKAKNVSNDKEDHSKHKEEHVKKDDHSKHKDEQVKKEDHSKYKEEQLKKEDHSKHKEEQMKNRHSSNIKHEDPYKSKHTSSKTDSHSKSKVSSSSDRNSHSKTKTHSSKDKKLSNEHSKENSHKRSFSDCDNKNAEQRSIPHKKCRKKEKEEETRQKSRSQHNNFSPERIMNIELSSEESDCNQSENDKHSSDSSDVEEIISNNGVTIVIDSSSNSSSSNDVIEDMNSHHGGSTSNSPPGSPPPNKKVKLADEEKAAPTGLNLQSILCERWRKARETVLMRSSAPGKIKISQVPNVKNLLNAKDELFAKANKKPLPSSSSGLKRKQVAVDEEYVPQPPTRIAHTPKESLAQYPVIKMDDNLSVPLSIRQSKLNNIFDEYKKFLPLSKAREQAVQKEFEICQRTKVTMTYQNSCALAVLRIRKTRGVEDEDEMQNTRKPTLRSDSIPDYTHGWTLYKCFQDYILSEEELANNGYPLPIEAHKGCAYIKKSARRFSNKQPEDESQRVCAHCSKLYFVDEDGFPLTENECFYHWGKLRRAKIRGGIAEIYICCKADAGSEPCTSGRYHVSSRYDEDCLEGFVTTLPLRSSQAIESAGIYGLDCEMIYTTQGLELARCTVVDLEGNLIYDKFVLPDYPVLDYCTRFSGVTEFDLKKATLKLKDVQRDLLGLINEKTIVVGHSLENDFKVLRIFHKTVVDTSVVFPHPRGLPFKKSLKHVSKEFLNINIQEQESGHDSKEDANAALQLMLWKIREDAKKRKPRVIISLDH